MSQEMLLQIDYLIYSKNFHSAAKRAFLYQWYAVDQITGNPFVAKQQRWFFQIP
jgi:hypothetical protein